MYEGNTAADAPARPVSPIEAAHAELRGAQDVLHNLLGSLHCRLESVLRPAEPISGSAVGPKAVDNPPMSELHAHLLDRVAQTRDQCSGIESLLRRLTL